MADQKPFAVDDFAAIGARLREIELGPSGQAAAKPILQKKYECIQCADQGYQYVRGRWRECPHCYNKLARPHP
jgi:hypothetical protein